MKPLVSVLMPVYNHEQFVEQAILSVLNQTYDNIELIVLDDGSTDESDVVIQLLLKKYQFEYYSQKNQGLVSTLNKLKKMGKGKYISILASDDMFEETKIEKLVTYLENNPMYAMVYSNMYMMDTNNTVIGKIKDSRGSGNLFDQLLCGEFFINSLTTLIRKDIYDQYEYEPMYIEDLQMWLKIAEKHQIGFVDEYTAFYRTNNANSLSANYFKMQEAEYQIISKYTSKRIYPKAINSWNIQWFGSLLLHNKKLTMQKYFIRILTSPYSYINIKFYKSLIRIFIWRYSVK